ncbi:MAG: hypothetical protein IKY33_03370 [Clostridia bacterium]|nr:hypothetical protein [Clostridia bacterium]
MALYLFADYVVDVQSRYEEYMQSICADYLYHGDAKPDITVRVTDEEMAKEFADASDDKTPEYIEYICTYRNLCLQLLEKDAFLFHGSTIACDGHGIIFTAQSGVGKTTHTKIWWQLFGKEKITIINGDKPIIRFKEDGKAYAYGTPWAGKENYRVNDKVQVTDLCFIERCETVSVERADKSKYIDFVLNQVLHPADPMLAIKQLELLDRFLSACNLWVIKCNISRQAGEMAYNTIIGGTKK